jgi:hypothetical protein
MKTIIKYYKEKIGKLNIKKEKKTIALIINFKII